MEPEECKTDTFNVTQTDLKMDFPFDLNNLFSLNYSFDVLKQAIEFLARE